MNVVCLSKWQYFLITDWLKLRQEDFLNIVTGNKGLENGNLQLYGQANKIHCL